MKNKGMHKLGKCIQCKKSAVFIEQHTILQQLLGLFLLARSKTGDDMTLTCHRCGQIISSLNTDLITVDDKKLKDTIENLLIRLIILVADSDGVDNEHEKLLLKRVSQSIDVNSTEFLARANDLKQDSKDTDVLFADLNIARHYLDRSSKLLILACVFQVSLIDEELHFREFSIIEKIARHLGLGRGSIEIALEVVKYGSNHHIDRILDELGALDSENKLNSPIIC